MSCYDSCYHSVMPTKMLRQRLPLHKAALEGRLEDLRRLIQSGAGVDDVDDQAWPGATALMCAIVGGLDKYPQGPNMGCFEALVEAGADLFAKDDFQNTVAMHAASTGSVRCLRVIFDAGVDLDSLNQEKMAAAMLARSKGRAGVADMIEAEFERRQLAENAGSGGEFSKHPVRV